ncbi:SDR family NAD(P)-dependent oxidoreductase [Micromonospora sp. DT228]|uniref:SDR family NAD(P)-dependent oxidoreductase n=1 Tax=Micromonospora sp. DT228 TaxID=3393443 RepID=UPI003CF099DB
MSQTTIALVTGANKGIGYEIAAGLGALGWSVGVGARNDSRREAAVEKLRVAGVDAFGVPLDVTDDASVAAAVRLVDKHAGGLDVLVNNAASPAVCPRSWARRDPRRGDLHPRRTAHLYGSWRWPPGGPERAGGPGCPPAEHRTRARLLHLMCRLPPASTTSDSGWKDETPWTAPRSPVFCAPAARPFSPRTSDCPEAHVGAPVGYAAKKSPC